MGIYSVKVCKVCIVLEKKMVVFCVFCIFFRIKIYEEENIIVYLSKRVESKKEFFL